jgi:hypothetical protein
LRPVGPGTALVLASHTGGCPSVAEVNVKNIFFQNQHGESKLEECVDCEQNVDENVYLHIKTPRQCYGSALVSMRMRIRIQLFILMRIRIQEAMADPDPVQTFDSQEVEFFHE